MGGRQDTEYHRAQNALSLPPIRPHKGVQYNIACRRRKDINLASPKGVHCARHSHAGPARDHRVSSLWD